MRFKPIKLKKAFDVCCSVWLNTKERLSLIRKTVPKNTMYWSRRFIKFWQMDSQSEKKWRDWKFYQSM